MKSESKAMAMAMTLLSDRPLETGWALRSGRGSVNWDWELVRGGVGAEAGAGPGAQTTANSKQTQTQTAGVGNPKWPTSHGHG